MARQKDIITEQIAEEVSTPPPAPEPRRVKVRIIAERHNDAGKEYFRDEILETDSTTAQWLIDQGVGERY